MDVYRKIISVLASILLAFTSFIACYVNKEEDKNKHPDFYEPVSTQTFTMFDAYLRGQSVTTDGEAYYFSSNYGIIKTQLDASTVICRNVLAIPPELLKLGCKHIGGISYMDGKIYAPIEDSKVFENLYLAVYDAETLQYIKSEKLPGEYHENGVPWCVADPDNKVIYTARRDHIEVVNVFDAETLQFKRTIPIESPIHKIQGGQMYQGILYLAISRDDQAVYAVDLTNGKVRKAFARHLVKDSEGEGMAILPTQDGLFHVLDIASVRVAVHFRHYDFDPATIQWK